MSETQEKRNVHETTIPANQYVEDAYVEFGREVNGNRMICDLSGCKPIWKKIIYMSHKIANGKLTKTADLAGQIMSKVHPHAECSSTISLLVRKNILAHKGNHGLDLLDSIPASAPRYTEVGFDKNKEDFFMKFIRYVPWNVNDLGNDEPDYLPVPIPVALMVGDTAIGLGAGPRLPAFTYSSLVNAFLKDDPGLLKSTYGYAILSADWDSLWEEGTGSIEFAMDCHQEWIDGRMCTVIEGKGDLFKPRMAMFKEWLDEGLIWVRDESTDHIRIVIGRSNNIRKISEDDIFEMGKRVTIFQRGYRILFYDNDEKIVKKIGIKYWIAKCMAKYKEYVELYKKDNISAAEYTILQLTHLPEVAKRIFSQMPSEKIASELNIDLELVKEIEKKPIRLLRKENFDLEIESLRAQINEVMSMDADALIQHLKSSF